MKRSRLNPMSAKRMEALRNGTAPKRVRKPMRARAKGNKSQVDVFARVWRERPHQCEVCGRPLFPMPDDRSDREAMAAWVRQFSHLLPKGSYRRAKDDTRNIRLKCHPHHDEWHEFKDHGLRYDPLWRVIFELYDALLIEYA